MGVSGSYGCGYWVMLLRRYIDFLILLIPTSNVSVVFEAAPLVIYDE